MLSAHDFRYMYENGKLPTSKKKVNSKPKDKNIDNISKEWYGIGIKLESIAKTFLNSSSPQNYPPCFYISIKYPDNIKRLQTELFFKVQRCSGIYSFDKYNYCLEF